MVSPALRADVDLCILSLAANFYIFFVSVCGASTALSAWLTRSPPPLTHQVIVTSSLEDPSFGVPKISVLNTILQYVYLGTLVACFLFSMGNRPAG